MPYVWTQADTRNAVVASLIPTSACIAGFCSLSKDKSVESFVQKFRPPSWAIRNQTAYICLDAAAISPLGYASYLVFKDGGGFDYTDTTVALGLYGLNIAGLLSLIPAFKKKNLKAITYITAANALTAAGAAIAFANISKKAGYFLVPYVIWSGYYAVIAFKVHQNNKIPQSIQELSEKTI